MRPMLTNGERARTYMRDAGIDALIAWSPSNVRYLTGYWCWLEPLFKEFMVRPGGSGAVAQLSYCLQPLEGDPCLVVEPLWAVDTLGTWVEDVRTPTQGITAAVPTTPNLPSDLAPHSEDARARRRTSGRSLVARRGGGRARARILPDRDRTRGVAPAPRPGAGKTPS